MHIALVNQWYPPYTGGGGVATHNFHFANACVELGHTVTVIANRPNPSTPAQHTLNGIKVLRIPSPAFYRARRIPVLGPQYRFVQALLYSRRVVAALAALHRENPVDVVEFAEVNAEGFFWREGLGKKMVVRCHTPAFVLERYYSRTEAPYDATLLGWAEKRVIRRAHALTSPSQDMAELIVRETGIPAARIHPIANALDTAAYAPAQQPPASDVLKILWVGRLERAKGIEVLISAIPIVCRQHANVRFVVVGGSRPHPEGGTYGEYIARTLDPYVKSGQLELRGFVPDSDLVATYQECHISVVPSVLYESFSYTVAQAMSCGLPVVASDIGGVRETLGNGTCGVLVSPGNAQEFADALNSLASDPVRRVALGKAARDHAVANFSARSVASRILEVYQAASGS